MGKDPEDVRHEERIVWTEDLDGFDHVRESLTTEAGTRKRPVPWRGPGRRVGYSVLKSDAPSNDSTFADWLHLHEVSVPETLGAAVGEEFKHWLWAHSEELVVAISDAVARQTTLPEQPPSAQEQ
ncbi:DUF6009 family protein [Streptomyces sp. NPDC059970]|uniref:DUF6009 family protein n=1 Tax=Streptomyces sp. NPDC059970 TaxID=3347019 RepID=UPI0036AD557D